MVRRLANKPVRWYHRKVSLSTLQRVRAKTAALRWRHPSRNVRLVLIGGSYGKTTTARFLAAILEEAGIPTAVFTNLGSQTPNGPYEATYDSGAGAIQHAISRSRKAGADVVIMEVSQAFLDSAVLDHVQCELSIITDDSPAAHELLRVASASVVAPQYVATDSYSISAHQMLTYGDDQLAEAHIAGWKLYRKGTEIDITIDHQIHLALATHLLGQATVYDVAAATAGAYMLGVDTAVFADGIARPEAIAGSMEPISHGAPYTVLLDVAPSETSVRLVSESAREIAKRRLLIACDTTIPHSALQPLGKLADRVTVVEGEEAEGRYHAASVEDALVTTLRSAKKDDLVLLLGADFAEPARARLNSGE